MCYIERVRVFASHLCCYERLPALEMRLTHHTVLSYQTEAQYDIAADLLLPLLWDKTASGTARSNTEDRLHS